MIRSLWSMFLLSICFSSCSSIDFNNDIEKLSKADNSEKIVLAEELMSKYPTSPIIEDSVVHIVYHGHKSEMSVAGDFNNWNPENGKMTNISGTNFWYLTDTFDMAAQLQYKLVSSSQDWFLDPRNPLQSSSDVDNSVIEMPQYIRETETTKVESVPAGVLAEYKIHSKSLGEERSFKVYFPASYNTLADDIPFVLVHDGYAYLEYAHMHIVLDNLIHQGIIPPIAAVFLPPVHRKAEYADSRQNNFKVFILEELYPWLTNNHNISDERGSAGVFGSSYGGTISLALAAEAPHIFGKVGAFSAFVSDDILGGFSQAELLPLEIYLNHGSYDHLVPIHESLQKFRNVLDSKQYSYRYEEYPEAHHYEFWRAHLDDALIYLFAK